MQTRCRAAPPPSPPPPQRSASTAAWSCLLPLPPSAVIVRTRVATHRRHFADRDGEHDHGDDEDEKNADAGTLAAAMKES
jgi:hypothetical protein